MLYPLSYRGEQRALYLTELYRASRKPGENRAFRSFLERDPIIRRGTLYPLSYGGAGMQQRRFYRTAPPQRSLIGSAVVCLSSSRLTIDVVLVISNSLVSRSIRKLENDFRSGATTFSR